jgi:NAD(P)-dependent dehydrogenase (short-subunit alcohol dehydrogenase family)
MTGVETRRVAVVTGTARGIGRRTAQLLASRGHTVVCVDRRDPRPIADEITEAGGDALGVVGDVGADAFADDLAALVAQRYGRVDVLVNNAGISRIAPVEETTPEQWRRVLDVNLTGPFLLSRALGRLMLARGAGSIVNVASVAGLAGIADRAAYNASKHGLVGLTRTLAAEWGGRGVRCNAVCPGWVKTEMDAADQADGGYTDADIEARVPMARFAAPDDVGEAIAFLADPGRSGFVNGVALPVDGGWVADAGWDSLRLRKR